MPGNRKDPQGYVILLHAASVFLETSEVGMWLFAQRPWLNHFISGSSVTSTGAPAREEWGGKADSAAFR